VSVCSRFGKPQLGATKSRCLLFGGDYRKYRASALA